MTNPLSPNTVTLPSFSQPFYIIMPLKKRKDTNNYDKNRNDDIFLASQGGRPGCWSSLAALSQSGSLHSL